MAKNKPTENLDANYLPTGYNGHGTSWIDFRENSTDLNRTGLAPNDKADPVFGMIPDCTEYGGSDC